MTYDIVAYDPDLLGQHVELGMELTRTWKYFGQTGLEVMRKQYSQPGFDPETRLYAVSDQGELLGFHTASVTRPGFARVEFPIVRPEHDHLVDELFEHQLEVLRSKGVTKIQSRATPFWGSTEELADRLGYTFVRDLYFVSEADPRQVASKLAHLGGEDLDLKDYDPRRHYAEVKRILMDHFDTSEQLAESYLEAYLKPSEYRVFNQAQVEGGRIVARAGLSVANQENEVKGYGTVYADRSDLVLPALAKVAAAATDRGADVLQCYFAGPDRGEMEELLGTIQLDFGSGIAFYQRKI